MKKFSYPNMNPFYANGELFYQKYKGAEFLKDERNIQNILCMPDELNDFVDDLRPGESLEMEGMFLKPGSSLFITKGDRDDEHDVDLDAFTPRRLSGLVAAYVYDHYSEPYDIYAREAEDLGLSWSKKVLHQQKIYLSAVSGAEYFVKHFFSFPLVCGLKKYQLKQITDERLVDMTRVRYHTGERVSTGLFSRLPDPEITFGGTFDLMEAIDTLPEEIRRSFDKSWDHIAYVSTQRRNKAFVL